MDPAATGSGPIFGQPSFKEQGELARPPWSHLFMCNKRAKLELDARRGLKKAKNIGLAGTICMR